RTERQQWAVVIAGRETLSRRIPTRLEESGVRSPGRKSLSAPERRAVKQDHKDHLTIPGAVTRRVEFSFGMGKRGGSGVVFTILASSRQGARQPLGQSVGLVRRGVEPRHVMPQPVFVREHLALDF